MSFDDLAKHMAARDRNKKLTTPRGNVDEIVAEAAKAARRMSRTRDLILGPLLLVGGITIAVLYSSWIFDLLHHTDSSHIVIPGPVPIGIAVGAIAMVIIGSVQTIRGLRGRSP
jgi:hypothetical protein